MSLDLNESYFLNWHSTMSIDFLTNLGPFAALSGTTNLYNKVKNTAQNLKIRCSNTKHALQPTSMGGPRLNLCKRRHVGLILGLSCLVIDSHEIKAAGLPAEEKPKLCDDACEKELENVGEIACTFYLRLIASFVYSNNINLVVLGWFTFVVA